MDHYESQTDDTISKEQGFKDWNEVESLQGRACDANFETAVDTMLSGDLISLRELMGRAPALLTARSPYGHRATLLHYAGTNGVESYRQVVPLNLATIVDFLIKPISAEEVLPVSCSKAASIRMKRKCTGM